MEHNLNHWQTENKKILSNVADVHIGRYVYFPVPCLALRGPFPRHVSTHSGE